MILEVLPVATLFLAVLGAALALAAVVLGARDWRRWTRAADPASRDAVEDRSHLVFLVVLALALVHALGWPLFHAVLVGYVDDLRPLGVMCAYGVTRLAPRLVLAIQLLKPLVLWGVGLWLLLALADRRSATAPFLGTRLVSAVVLAALALAEAALEIAYVTGAKLEETVTCCSELLTTSAATVPAGADPRGALPLAGAGSPAVFALVNALVIALALALCRAGLRAGGRGLAQALGLVLLAAVNLAVTRDAWAGALAPRVLGLPYHHCLYEVVSATPGLALAALLALAGNGALAWPLALQLVRARAPELVGTLQRSVYGLVAVALASELFLVAAHWL